MFRLCDAYTDIQRMHTHTHNHTRTHVAAPRGTLLSGKSEPIVGRCDGLTAAAAAAGAVGDAGAINALDDDVDERGDGVSECDDDERLLLLLVLLLRSLPLDEAFLSRFLSS
jgi:hypothetical protein